MNVARTIRRVGFRKWYERELLRSHAHLVLLLLSSIGLLGSAEAYSLRLGLSSQLVVLACAVASAIVGVWSLRRYLYLLAHADFVADQAVCRACNTYARWDIEEDHGGADRGAHARSLQGLRPRVAHHDLGSPPGSACTSCSRPPPHRGQHQRPGPSPGSGQAEAGSAVFLEWGLALHAVWVRRFVEADSRG